MKSIQIKSIFGKLLFEHSSENNSIKETLSEANLRGANLSEADLSGANLSKANLSEANLPMYCKWSVSIVDNKYIKIGCKQNTIEGWDAFFVSTETFETKRGTPEFKQIQAMYNASKAYLLTLNN